MTARFLALYESPADPAAFDRHYREIHIPLGCRLPGLRRYVVGRDVAAVRGGAPYYLVAELDWDTMDELRAAFGSPEGRATAADAARLAELAPVCSMIFTVAETFAPDTDSFAASSVREPVELSPFRFPAPIRELEFPWWIRAWRWIRCTGAGDCPGRVFGA